MRISPKDAVCNLGNGPRRQVYSAAAAAERPAAPDPHFGLGHVGDEDAVKQGDIGTAAVVNAAAVVRGDVADELTLAQLRAAVKINRQPGSVAAPVFLERTVVQHRVAIVTDVHPGPRAIIRHAVSQYAAVRQPGTAPVKKDAGPGVVPIPAVAAGDGERLQPGCLVVANAADDVIAVVAVVANNTNIATLDLAIR